MSEKIGECSFQRKTMQFADIARAPSECGVLKKISHENLMYANVQCTVI